MRNRIDVVVGLMKSNGYTSYTEVGTKQGRMLCEVVKQTKCAGIGVDPFCNVPNDGESYEEWDFETIKAEYDANVEGKRITTYVSTSIEAASVAPDCDLVFIDAAHDYENMHRDILAWRPKCKLISGHDYDDKFPGIMKAVDELVPNRKLEADSVWWAYAVPPPPPKRVLRGWDSW